MKKARKTRVCALGAALLLGALMAGPHMPLALDYDGATGVALPIPPAERGLVTEVARPFFSITRDNHILEGARFDRDGNVYFCDVTGARIMRISQDKTLEVVLESKDGFVANGLAFHKDGRLFVCANNYPAGEGVIYALDLETKESEIILPSSAGFFPNDLVFDSKGGFYFTDFKGTSTVPAGGVYYMAPGFTKVQAVIPNLCKANGVALSPDGKILYATEFARNTLHLAFLKDEVTPLPTGAFAAYHFAGPGPDSMRTDQDGNVYVALARQGRVLVFNRIGIPIGQVLIPGRDEGRAIRTTSLDIRHESRQMIVVTGSDSTDRVEGSALYEATAFANGRCEFEKPEQEQAEENQE